MDKKTKSALQTSFWALNTSLDHANANLLDIQEACDQTSGALALVAELCIVQLETLKHSVSVLQDAIVEGGY